MYSCFATLIPFEISKLLLRLISKEISRAEHEYMNMYPLSECSSYNPGGATGVKQHSDLMHADT